MYRFPLLPSTRRDREFSSCVVRSWLHRRRNDYQNDIRWPVEIPSRNHGVNGRRYSVRVTDEKFVKRIRISWTALLSLFCSQGNNPCSIEKARHSVLFDKRTWGSFCQPRWSHAAEYNFDTSWWEHVFGFAYISLSLWVLRIVSILAKQNFKTRE